LEYKKIVITKKSKKVSKSIKKIAEPINEICTSDNLILQKIKDILKSQKFLDELNEHVSEYAFHEFYMDCWSKNITINDFININKKEHSVIVGVKFGNIFQNALKKTLNEIMSNEITDSEKDLELFNIPFELKTVREGLNFQGATHSFRKCNNYILLMYIFNDNKIMSSINDILINGICLSVSMNLITKSNWYGTASEKNSRTTLKLPNDIINEVKHSLIYGNAKSKQKWISLTTEPISYSLKK